MKLQDASRKWKFENATTYYFEDSNEVYASIIVTKQRSGYDVEMNNYKLGTYKHTDGLKNMDAVKNFIS